MNEADFLCAEVLVALHARLVAAFGGPTGFNNEGLFASALHRPLNLWHYGRTNEGSPGPDLFDLAASHAYGLIKNHAFLDGNKRIGAAACLMFLRLNGQEVSARPAQLVTVFVAVARGRMTEEALACWLRCRRA